MRRVSPYVCQSLGVALLDAFESDSTNLVIGRSIDSVAYSPVAAAASAFNLGSPKYPPSDHLPAYLNMHAVMLFVLVDHFVLDSRLRT